MGIQSSLTRQPCGPLPQMQLFVAANHELNMCRRDMFKADLDEDFKAISSSKQTVGGELFGDDLTERLKVVTERNKASKRLTRHKKRPYSRLYQYGGRSNYARPFLSTRGGRYHGGRSQQPQQGRNSPYPSNKTSKSQTKKPRAVKSI